MGATRLWNLIKYLSFCAVIGTEHTHKLIAKGRGPEPEDREYYGVGARSSRQTLLLFITLIFSTVSPVICILAYVNFTETRMIYRYLFVFAETIKPDNGGGYFVNQLYDLQKGLGVYVIMMAGIL